MSDSIDRFRSVRESAAIIGVTERTIYENIKSGRLRTLRLGRLHRIRESDLLGLLHERGADAGQESGSES